MAVGRQFETDSRTMSWDFSVEPERDIGEAVGLAIHAPNAGSERRAHLRHSFLFEANPLHPELGLDVPQLGLQPVFFIEQPLNAQLDLLLRPDQINSDLHCSVSAYWLDLRYHSTA